LAHVFNARVDESARFSRAKSHDNAAHIGYSWPVCGRRSGPNQHNNRISVSAQERSGG
jgi:hypothetical protein